MLGGEQRSGIGDGDELPEQVRLLVGGTEGFLGVVKPMRERKDGPRHRKRACLRLEVGRYSTAL